VSAHRSVVRFVLILAASGALLLPGLPASAVPRYASSTDEGVRVRVLLSVGDRVPRTGDRGARFRMVGRPDGLGVLRDPAVGSTLFMSHELDTTVRSRPLPGEAAVRGSFVSAWRLDGHHVPTSGDVAFDDVYQDRRRVGPLATAANTTPAFGRFCSGFLAGAAVGFDPPMYLASEEATAPATFDPRGGQTVAIYDGQAHALSSLGFLQRENAIVQPSQDRRTAIVVLEDVGGSDGQLYLYLGRKDPRARHPLVRNGLVGGTLFVFAADDPGITTEADVGSGAIGGRWMPIPGADGLDDVALEQAADAAGALGFERPEDGAFPASRPQDLFFATTGGDAGAGNGLGRLYHLALDPRTPRGAATLRLAYDADRTIGDGGDGPISPDNLDVVGGHLFVQEDATSLGAAALTTLGREAGIWRFELRHAPLRSRLASSSATLVVSLAPPGRDGTPLPGPGLWESSGIVATGRPGEALFDVMAHAPTTAPGVGTVEDGQLLFLRHRT